MRENVWTKDLIVAMVIFLVISGITPSISFNNETLGTVSSVDSVTTKESVQPETEPMYVPALHNESVDDGDQLEEQDDQGYPMYPPTEIGHLENCYGYAIPLVRGENIPTTSIQQSIAYLINDLLRMNISVFWVSADFSAVTIRFSDNSLENRVFEKGTYIVSFTGDHSKDALLSIIINDFAYESEIDIQHRVETYYLMEPLTLDVYPLNYAKVAYHLGAGVHYYLLLCYLDSLQQGGFLDNRILLDNDIATDLNNNDFNVFIWPGANLGLGFAGWRGTIKTTLRIRSSQKIRSFVEHGGGYIGSCYGKSAASSGFLIPVNLLAHHNPNLPVTHSLALLPTAHSITFAAGYVTVKIVNMSHPVSFGLSETQRSWRGNGPVDIWLGKDAQPLATLENFTFQWKGKDFRNIPYWVIETITKYELGKPIWTTGVFFKGKIVTFGDHPEMPEPYRLDRLLHNAVFFTTADPQTTLSISKNVSLPTIRMYNNATSNLPLNQSGQIFTTLWSKIDSLSDLCEKIDAIEKKILDIVLELADEEKIDGTLKYKIATEYRDSYLRWLTGFRTSLQTLENIIAEVQFMTNVTSDRQSWETQMNETLQTCEHICRTAYEMSNVMHQKLTDFVGEKLELLSIRLLADKRDNNFRNGSTQFIIPWMSTEKLLRKIWYDYEREVAVTTNLSPPTESKQQKSTHETSSGILYVDIDAPPNGDGSIQHPYRIIQDAIDAASDQDIIVVSEGVYKGTITIHKSITLIGENKDTTIIDGEHKPHCVVTSTAPNVKIRGFTIKNSAKQLLCGGVLLQDSNNTVQDNIIIENRYGLGLRPMSSNNIIKDNIFINNSCMGLVIDELDSINNTIHNNTFIHNNQQGLNIANAQNTVIDNTFIDDGITISKTSGPLTTIIHNNTANGKPIYCLTDVKDLVIPKDAGQVILSNCENITINDITIQDIDTAIIVLDSRNINIMHCHLMDNLVGISVQYSEDIILQNNHIANNSWSGIWGYHVNNITITNNTITGNDDAILLHSSRNSVIQYNNVTQNTIGIFLASRSTQNLVEKNNFIENNKHVFSTGHNRYKENYWDDWIGVQHPLLRFFPKTIKQESRLIRWYAFDWHPAQEPYTIPRTP
jgi:parallel beta-helix repeat protein